MRQSISLRQLNQMVSQAVACSFTEGVWVVAEINSMQDRGHCYLELIEKDPDTDTVTAKASATIWRNVFIKLRMDFFKATGVQLASGMKVLVLARPTFHPQYGYSLNITDIDPTYTVGEAALKRAAVIKQLKDEGVYDLNRQQTLPMLIKRIAVISSPLAAGYGDFMNQLGANQYGYVYSVTLYEAIMQGEGAETSIIEALDRIAAETEKFDAVVIVRGGGAVSDLSCYDRYGVAACVAQFPLPVLTGIGHDRDVSVVDEVACVHLKTPTAVASFIIESTFSVHQRLTDVLLQLNESVRLYIQNHTQKIDSLSSSIASNSHLCLERHKNRVDVIMADVRASVSAYLTRHHHRIDMAQQVIELTSPQNILKKGYSITMKDGLVASAATLKTGDVIETRFSDGVIKSRVNN